MQCKVYECSGFCHSVRCPAASDGLRLSGLVDHLSMTIVSARSCQSRIFMLRCLARLSELRTGLAWCRCRDSQECWVSCSLSLSPQTGPLTESGLRMAASRPSCPHVPTCGTQGITGPCVHSSPRGWGHLKSVLRLMLQGLSPSHFSLAVKSLFHSWCTPMLGTGDTAPLLCWF